MQKQYRRGQNCWFLLASQALSSNRIKCQPEHIISEEPDGAKSLAILLSRMDIPLGSRKARDKRGVKSQR